MGSPRNLGSIPTAALQAGCVEHWDFFRVDASTTLYFTDRPGGFVGDIGDGSGSQTWVGEKGLDAAAVTQADAVPEALDSVNMSDVDYFWTNFILTAASGVWDIPVELRVGWFQADGSFFDSYADFGGYIDGISIHDFVATIALKAQDTAHNRSVPALRYSYPAFPLLAPPDYTVQFGADAGVGQKGLNVHALMTGDGSILGTWVQRMGYGFWGANAPKHAGPRHVTPVSNPGLATVSGPGNTIPVSSAGPAVTGGRSYVPPIPRHVIPVAPPSPAIVNEGGDPPPFDPGDSANPVVTPSATDALPMAQGRLLTIPALEATIPGIWGHVMCGGAIMNTPVFVNNRLYVAYGIACHQVSDLYNIKWGTVTLDSLGLTPGTDYKIYKGGSSQTLDSQMHTLNAAWTYAYNGTETTPDGMPVPEMTWFWVALPPPNSKIPSIDPWSMTCEVKGALCRDPRLDSTLVNRYYTENWALIAADVKTRPWMGAFKDSKLDWTTIGNAASGCDALLSDGVTKRYYGGGVILRTTAPYPQVEDLFRQHLMGVWVFNSGKFQLYIDQAQSASGISFSDGSDGARCNTRAGAEIEISTVPSDQIVTVVEVTYIEITGSATTIPDSRGGPSVTLSSASFKEKTVSVRDPGTLTGAVAERKASYRLGVGTSDFALRLATEIYNHCRLDKQVTVPANEEYQEVLPMIVITVTGRNGLSNKPVLVQNVKRLGAHVVGGDIIGKIYDVGAYSSTLTLLDDVATVPPIDATAYPPAPTFCTATEAIRVGPDGRTTAVIALAWTPQTSWGFYQATHVTVSIDSGPETDVGYFSGSIGTFDFPSPVMGKLHAFAFYTVSRVGSLETDPAMLSAGTGEASCTPVFNGSTTIPDVTGITAPNATDHDLGMVYWGMPTGVGSEFVSGANVYVQVAGTWRFWGFLDLSSQPTSSNPLNLRPFVQGSPTTGYSFAVKAACRAMPGQESAGVTASWSLPPSASPIVAAIPFANLGYLTSSSASWSTARGGSALAATNGQLKVESTWDGASTYTICRTFAEFSTILPVGVTISSAVLRLNIGTIINPIGAGDLDIVIGTESNDPPHTSDWAAVGSTLFGSATLSSLIVGTNDVVLNTTGIAAINTTGMTRLALRLSFDVSNSTPSTANEILRAAVDATQAQLIISYTDPGLGGGGGGGGSTVIAFRVVLDGSTNVVTLPGSPTSVSAHFDRSPMTPPDSGGSGGDYTIAGPSLTITPISTWGAATNADLAGHVVWGEIFI